MNWRYFVLAMLACVAFFGIFSEPREDYSVTQWIIAFVASKGIGLLSAWAGIRLAKYWESKHLIIL